MGRKNKKKNEPGPSGGGGGDAPADGKPKPQQPPKQDKPKPESDPAVQGGKGKKQVKDEQQHEGGAPQASSQPHQKSDQQHQQKGQKKQHQKVHQEPGPSQTQQHVQQQKPQSQQESIPSAVWGQQSQQKVDQPQQQQQPKGKKQKAQKGQQQQQQQSSMQPAEPSAPQQQQTVPQPQQQHQQKGQRKQQQQGQQPQSPLQQQFTPPQQQGMFQQSAWGPRQQQQLPPQQQQQWTPPPQQQQQWTPSPQQQQQWTPSPQQQQRGPQQQQQQRTPQQPQQLGSQQQQQHWTPQQHQQRTPQQQQQRTPQQQQQRMPQQQQQRTPHQQQSGSRQHYQQLTPGQPQQHGRDQHYTQEYRESPPSGRGTRESTPMLKESLSVQSIASAISDISVKPDERMVPYHGKKGRPIKMEANYVELQLSDKIKTGYHYDVTIEPDKPKRLLRLAFAVFAATNFPQIQLAYDGRANCYSPQKLTEKVGKQIEVTVEDVEFQQKKTFKVTLKQTETYEVDMTSLKNYRNNRVFDKPMRAMQLLDVVLQQACVQKARQGGRSYYKRPDTFIDLEDGYQLYLGLFQSMVLGDTPLLNIDVSHKAFPVGGKLIDYMRGMNFDTSKELSQFDVRRLDEYLKGLRLTYTPPKEAIENGKDYTFNAVKGPSNREMFEFNGKKITILDYFQKVKNSKITYPHLPCLWVGGKNKQVLLPIEFCSLREGQVTNKKAGTKQVRNMIKYAATSTVDRKKRIMDLYNYFAHMRNPCVSAFGLRLGAEFITIDARIINAPDILYNGRSVRVNKGSWNNQNMQFIQPVKDIKWAILYTDQSYKFDLKKLVDQTKSTARSLNMTLSENHVEELCRDERSQRGFLERCKKENVSLVFVILNRNRDCYSRIKVLAETEIGILTQCIKGETLQRRMNQSTISNILLKVNTKLNGQNHKIEPKTEVPLLLNPKNTIMFVGADVTHPSPDQMRIPSVVGVVSSYNETFSKYYKTFRLQDPKQEMIQDMCAIMQEHLKYFKECRNVFPNKIIYYRDGVSDGQFEDLRKIELTAMDQACAKMDPKYKPQITCVVVQKRHHTRFFPNPNDVRNDRYLNAPPGTVVDKKITHPREFQFFLVSHESIQGTAKPTKYCVIRDDSKIDVDEMQAMTYNLCHMFARCNRAVSYPAPAYYAHLAAARGRVYIENNRFLDMRNLKREYEKLMARPDFFRRYPTFFI